MIFLGSIPSAVTAAVLALIGFCVGVIGGFFGIGGGFLVTPALNIMGFPMVRAIGTDLAHITGKYMVVVIRHWKLGHVDCRAGCLLLAGTLPGVKLGTVAVMKLESLGLTETVVRLVYIPFLTVIGVLVLRESIIARQKDEPDGRQALLRRRFLIRPLTSLKASGIERISVWGIIGLGLLTGFLASFLGVGGGFIRMPAMLYLIGMPTRMAVGTGPASVLFTVGYGTFLYAQQGHVDVIAALIMVIGASAGSQLGAQATKYAASSRIRFYLGVTIFGGALAVTAKQLGMAGVSAGILFALGVSLTAIILRGLWEGWKNDQSTVKAEVI